MLELSSAKKNKMKKRIHHSEGFNRNHVAFC